MEQKNLAGRVLKGAAYLAVVAPMICSLNSCSTGRTKYCYEFVNEVYSQMNKEGRRINDRFGDVDFGNSCK